MTVNKTKHEINTSDMIKYIEELLNFKQISTIVNLCEHTQFSVKIGIRYDYTGSNLYLFLFIDIYQGEDQFMLPADDIDYEGGHLCSSTNIAVFGKKTHILFDFKQDQEFIEDLELIRRKLTFYTNVK